MPLPVRTRAMFGCQPNDIVGTVADLPVRATQLKLRTMNFGQQWQTPNLENVLYCLRIPVSFVVHVLEQELPEFIDDSIRLPSDDSFETMLRRRNWPTVETIINDEWLRVQALEFYGQEILLKWLGDGEPDESPGYVINSIEVCCRLDWVIEFNGFARRAGQAVMYQDV